MQWISTHGSAESDIFQCNEWELVRKILGFDIERVAIIRGGVKVHQIEAQEGLRRAMDWCSAQEQRPFFGER